MVRWVNLYQIMDQTIGDRSWLRRGGASLTVKPLRIGDLILLRLDLSALVFGGEGHHQLVWEGPALATTVADIFDLDAHLFRNFPTHGVLGGLSHFDESGDAGIDILVALHMAGQEDLVALVHQDDDTWFDSWEVGLFAVVANPGGQLCVILQRSAAFAAELIIPAPGEQSACACETETALLVILRKKLANCFEEIPLWRL